LDLHEQLAPTEPFAHLRAAEALAAKKPLHPLSYLAVAQAALACKLWGKARQQLQAIVDLEPLPDAFRLMAALEKSEHGSKEAAYKWLDKPPRRRSLPPGSVHPVIIRRRNGRRFVHPVTRWPAWIWRVETAMVAMILRMPHWPACLPVL
jgi:uncharacterized membrane-anchored protein